LANEIIEISSPVLDNINHKNIDLFVWVQLDYKGNLINGGFDK
jgi:hypothetical protein